MRYVERPKPEGYFDTRIACVAGVRKERGRELGRETTTLPLPLLTPATQANTRKARATSKFRRLEY